MSTVSKLNPMVRAQRTARVELIREIRHVADAMRAKHGLSPNTLKVMAAHDLLRQINRSGRTGFEKHALFAAIATEIASIPV